MNREKPDYEWENEDICGFYYFLPNKIDKIKAVIRNIPSSYDFEDLWWAIGEIKEIVNE